MGPCRAGGAPAGRWYKEVSVEGGGGRQEEIACLSRMHIISDIHWQWLYTSLPHFLHTHLPHALQSPLHPPAVAEPEEAEALKKSKYTFESKQTKMRLQSKEIRHYWVSHKTSFHTFRQSDPIPHLSPVRRHCVVQAHIGAPGEGRRPERTFIT